MDGYFELIRARQSCRSFAEKPVEREKIVRCAEAARLAPSACNGQPWGFVAVNGGKLRESAAKSTRRMGGNQWTQTCPAFIAVVDQGASPLNLAGRASDKKWSQFDLGLAVMQFCLAATAQGLSTCIIGAFDEAKAREVMRLSPKEKLCALIALGYAGNDPPREKKRRDLKEILRFAE